MGFGTLALVVAAGLVGPLLAAPHRFSPPVVVGQILAGAVIGGSGFGWVDPADPFLTGLAAVGFALLMFVVGTHLPVRDPRVRRAALAGAGVTATVLAAGVLVGVVVGPAVGLDRPWVLMVLVGTSSGAVALPVLQDGGGEGRGVLVGTAWIALADVVTVLLVPVVMTGGSVARVLAGGAAVVGAGGVLYVAGRLARGRVLVRRLRAESHARGWGLDLRVSLLALFACAWLAGRFGTSVMIAGFTVGAVVALLGEPRRVADQLVGVGEGFVIPLFFVHLGARLDVGALVESQDSLRLAAVVFLVAVVLHVGAAWAWRLPAAIGLLATAQLGVPSAVVSLGLANGRLDAAQASGIMAAVLASLAACAAGGAMLGHRRTLTDASAPLHRA